MGKKIRNYMFLVLFFGIMCYMISTQAYTTGSLEIKDASIAYELDLSSTPTFNTNGNAKLKVTKDNVLYYCNGTYFSSRKVLIPSFSMTYKNAAINREGKKYDVVIDVSGMTVALDNDKDDYKSLKNILVAGGNGTEGFWLNVWTCKDTLDEYNYNKNIYDTSDGYYIESASANVTVKIKNAPSGKYVFYAEDFDAENECIRFGNGFDTNSLHAKDVTVNENGAQVVSKGVNMSACTILAEAKEASFSWWTNARCATGFLSDSGYQKNPNKIVNVYYRDIDNPTVNLSNAKLNNKLDYGSSFEATSIDINGYDYDTYSYGTTLNSALNATKYGGSSKTITNDGKNDYSVIFWYKKQATNKTVNQYYKIRGTTEDVASFKTDHLKKDGTVTAKAVDVTGYKCTGYSETTTKADGRTSSRDAGGFTVDEIKYSREGVKFDVTFWYEGKTKVEYREKSSSKKELHTSTEIGKNASTTRVDPNSLSNKGSKKYNYSGYTIDKLGYSTMDGTANSAKSPDDYKNHTIIFWYEEQASTPQTSDKTVNQYYKIRGTTEDVASFKTDPLKKDGTVTAKAVDVTGYKCTGYSEVTTKADGTTSSRDANNFTEDEVKYSREGVKFDVTFWYEGKTKVEYREKSSSKKELHTSTEIGKNASTTRVDPNSLSNKGSKQYNYSGYTVDKTGYSTMDGTTDNAASPNDYKNHTIVFWYEEKASTSQTKDIQVKYRDYNNGSPLVIDNNYDDKETIDIGKTTTIYRDSTTHTSITNSGYTYKGVQLDSGTISDSSTTSKDVTKDNTQVVFYYTKNPASTTTEYPIEIRYREWDGTADGKVIEGIGTTYDKTGNNAVKITSAKIITRDGTANSAITGKEYTYKGASRGNTSTLAITAPDSQINVYTNSARVTFWYNPPASQPETKTAYYYFYCGTNKIKDETITISEGSSGIITPDATIIDDSQTYNYAKKYSIGTSESNAKNNSQVSDSNSAGRTTSYSDTEMHVVYWYSAVQETNVSLRATYHYRCGNKQIKYSIVREFGTEQTVYVKPVETITKDGKLYRYMGQYSVGSSSANAYSAKKVTDSSWKGTAVNRSDGEKDVVYWYEEAIPVYYKDTNGNKVNADGVATKGGSVPYIASGALNQKASNTTYTYKGASKNSNTHTNTFTTSTTITAPSDATSVTLWYTPTRDTKQISVQYRDYNNGSPLVINASYDYQETIEIGSTATVSRKSTTNTSILNSSYTYKGVQLDNGTISANSVTSKPVDSSNTRVTFYYEKVNSVTVTVIGVNSQNNTKIKNFVSNESVNVGEAKEYGPYTITGYNAPERYSVYEGNSVVWPQTNTVTEEGNSNKANANVTREEYNAGVRKVLIVFFYKPKFNLTIRHVEYPSNTLIPGITNNYTSPLIPGQDKTVYSISGYRNYDVHLYDATRTNELTGSLRVSGLTQYGTGRYTATVTPSDQDMILEFRYSSQRLVVEHRYESDTGALIKEPETINLPNTVTPLNNNTYMYHKLNGVQGTTTPVSVVVNSTITGDQKLIFVYREPSVYMNNTDPNSVGAKLDCGVFINTVQNQYVSQSATEKYWVLDENGSITLRYANDDSAGLKNGASKAKVTFPFAVMVNSHLYPKGEAIEFTLNGESSKVKPANGANYNVFEATISGITIPVWEKEKAYTKNAEPITVVVSQDFALKKYNESTRREDTENKTKTDSGKAGVTIVGAVYDFTVHNIDGAKTTGDEVWKASLFGGTNAGKEYEADTLPIGQGVATQQNAKYIYGIKKGTRFYYSLKTKGTASDSIVITPKFYAINSSSTLEEVDVWSKGKKITFDKVISLTDSNLTSINGYQAELQSGQSVYGKENYMGVQKLSSDGNSDNIILGKALRMPYLGYGNNATDKNDFDEVSNIQDHLQSVSHWYGSFSIPNDAVYYKAGSTTEKVSGLLVVYFSIETKKETNRYLAYNLSSPFTGASGKSEWIYEGGTNINNESILPILKLNTNVTRFYDNTDTLGTSSNSYMPVIIYGVQGAQLDSSGTH